ncbi:MAG TPA: DUF72 domain-containing protein [Flavitalea sp.]|nr:DUF72 domain-containing protein [Flavitalea sp.]
MRKRNIHIGTSGWHYKHWKGTFYPDGIKESQQFEAYMKYFSTVELNNSFYMLPAAQTFENWRNATPKNFVFAVKSSRFFTHMKKLIVDKSSISKFFTNASRLEEKLGVVLFQLPPRWQVNSERLETFIAALPKGNRYTFEFREHSWYNEEVYAILRNNNCAFCIYELEYHLSPMEVTADFVYVRLHGPGNKYQGSYSETILKEWAVRCKDWQKKGKDVFIYFDNDQEGYAAFNAVRLNELVM